jgi:hypothetical protein
MRLKEMVMEMLQHGDRRGLEELVSNEPRSVRHIQGRLWDTDAGVRRNAAEALGAAAAIHPDLGREILRRALWALNDESATNGAPMLAAIGEIGSRNPDLVAPFVAPMTSFLWDDGLRPGILGALQRIADAAPALVLTVREQLMEYRQIAEPEERVCLDRLLVGNRESADGV